MNDATSIENTNTPMLSNSKKKNKKKEKRTKEKEERIKCYKHIFMDV